MPLRVLLTLVLAAAVGGCGRKPPPAPPSAALAQSPPAVGQAIREEVLVTSERCSGTLGGEPWTAGEYRTRVLREIRGDDNGLLMAYPVHRGSLVLGGTTYVSASPLEGVQLAARRNADGSWRRLLLTGQPTPAQRRQLERPLVLSDYCPEGPAPVGATWQVTGMDVARFLRMSADAAAGTMTLTFTRIAQYEGASCALLTVNIQADVLLRDEREQVSRWTFALDGIVYRDLNTRLDVEADLSGSLALTSGSFTMQGPARVVIRQRPIVAAAAPFSSRAGG
jgi:hypothetical protein